MHTITTKVSDDINTRLDILAKTIDRNKSYLLRKAIESFLEQKESYLISLHRLEEKGPSRLLEKDYDPQENDLEN
jgi:RHH-type rel operon transcriptional repressor/antitoxin RelB